MLVPFFQYWEFCDSRLYYECLRARMLLVIPDKDALTSPVFYFIVAILMSGVSSITFTSLTSVEAFRNFARATAPVFLPVCSFLATMYCRWDLKYFLITLANFAKDLDWSSEYLEECVQVTEQQLKLAFERKQRDGWSGDTTSTREVFKELRLAAVDLIENTPREITWAKDQRMSLQKAIKLLCGGSDWWLKSLLWMPTDMRAVHFRISFRIFACCCSVLMVITFFMIASTSLNYLVLQEHLTREAIGIFGWLQNLMISGLVA